MKFTSQTVLLTLILSVAVVGTALPQHSKPAYDKPAAFRDIDNAYQRGDISLDQKVLFKFYAISNTGKLPSPFRSGTSGPIKCGTPAITDLHRNRSKLSGSSINEIQSIISDASLQASKTHRSSSGRFRIHYETTGPHAVPGEDGNGNNIPDYVEKVAESADSTYRHEVLSLGYSNPISPGEIYNIEIVNLENIYGQTFAPGRYGGETSIQIENDFAEGFPPNDHPAGDQAGAIKATIAHEFKHAIQYTANQWRGETGNWLEMDATLMEEVVYDNVNDYYNYLTNEASIFSNPDQSFYPGSYYHVTWALYFSEKFGSPFWVQVWDIIRNNPYITMTNAISRQLGDRRDFDASYIESLLWHYASGDNSIADFGFEESAAYPTPDMSYNFVGDESLSAPDTMHAFSAKFFNVKTSPFPGTIEISYSDFSTLESAYAIIGYFKNGHSTPLLPKNENQKYNTSWKWRDIERLGIVTANSNPYNQVEYGLTIRSINPENFRVEQNYPNPFKNQTTFRFSLPEGKHVKLEIFNILGQKVATLIDNSKARGIHKITYKADNLASGVYLYRMTIGKKVTIKKMTLIK